MRRVLRWVGFVTVGLIALLILGLVVSVGVARRGKNRKWDVTPTPVVIPTDAAARTEGERLYLARGCAECHGRDAGGKVAVDDPGLGLMYGPNLTRGRGSVISEFADLDWVRSIRHGVKRDGRSVMMMPANEYNHIGDLELGRLIAYLKNLPPIDRDRQPDRLGTITYVVYALGLFPLYPAELIDHKAPRPVEPAIGITVEYGQHLAHIQCVGCHGINLSGGAIPGAPPSIPIPKNLTKDEATGLGKWSQADFVKLMRSGKRPNGSDVNPFMPWQVYSNLNDIEISALWTFLQSLPPRQFGGR